MNTLVVDAETVREFLEKSEPFFEASMLADWNARLRRRSDLIGVLRADPQTADTDAWFEPLRVTRRMAGPERERALHLMRPLVPLLAAGDTEGVLACCEACRQTDPWLLYWSTFWLHLGEPALRPWWSRWMYDPVNKTGAFPLVVDNPLAIGETVPDIYGQMVHATSFLGAVLDSMHRLSAIDEEFRPAVMFALVYAVYLFTMASWKLTTEFTQVLPSFPRVVRTLLAINR